MKFLFKLSLSTSSHYQLCYVSKKADLVDNTSGSVRSILRNYRISRDWFLAMYIWVPATPFGSGSGAKAEASHCVDQTLYITLALGISITYLSVCLQTINRSQLLDRCYGLNACEPPPNTYENSYVEVPTSSVILSGHKISMVVIRIRWGDKGKALIWWD